MNPSMANAKRAVIINVGRVYLPPAHLIDSSKFGRVKPSDSLEGSIQLFQILPIKHPAYTARMVVV